jgi:hypothetical protein
VAGVVLAIVVASGLGALARIPAFHLHELAITGERQVTRDEIARRAAIDPRANIWLLDTKAVERRIEAIAYVREARVRRRPPGNVWIDITERTPAGCVRDSAGHEWLVDADLRVLEEFCTPAASVTYDLRAPLEAGAGTFLRTPELRDLVTDAALLGAASHAGRYRAFSHDRFGDLQAVMDDGIAVRFGDDGDLDRKERLIGPILAELGPRLDNVRALDVRAPATPVVLFGAQTPKAAAHH